MEPGRPLVPTAAVKLKDIFYTAAVCTCCAHIMNIHTAMLSPMITINLYNDSFFCERNEERLLSVNEP